MNIETYEQKKTKNITAIRLLDTWKTASRRLVLELGAKFTLPNFWDCFFTTLHVIFTMGESELNFTKHAQLKLLVCLLKMNTELITV